MLSKILSKSYFVSLLFIVSFKEFAKCKVDELEFWERDPKFWQRDAKSTTSSRIKVLVKNSAATVGRRQVPPVEHLKLPYSRDGDNLFAADYKVGEVKTQSKNGPKSQQETELHRGGDNKEVSVRAYDHNRERYGRDRDRNRDNFNKNQKGYGNNEHKGYKEHGRNHDFYDDGALAVDITGNGQDIDYGRTTKNKKDSGGRGIGQSIVDSRENRKHTRGLPMGTMDHDRNRDRGRPKNNNMGTKYSGGRNWPGMEKTHIPGGGQPYRDKEFGSDRGKPIVNKDNTRFGRGKSIENKEDTRFGHGKRIESKEDARPASRGHVTIGLHSTQPSDHGRSNKNENRGPGRGGRFKDMEERPGHGGKIDDFNEKRKPGRDKPIKDIVERPGRGGRINNMDEKSKPARGRSIKDIDERPGRGGRIDDIDEKRKGDRGRLMKDIHERLGPGERLDDMDEKRKPGHGKPIKDTDERPGHGGRIDDMNEKSKPGRGRPIKDVDDRPGRNRPMPGVKESHYGRPYTNMKERHTTSHNKGGPGHGGIISDMKDRREPGSNRPIVDIDQGRGPSRNKPIHSNDHGPGRNKPNSGKEKKYGRDQIKKIARDPTYSPEENHSGDGKQEKAKKHGHGHAKEAITKAFDYKKEKHHPRYTKGLQDDQAAHEHESDNEGATVETQEVVKHKPNQGPHRQGHKRYKGKNGKQQEDTILRNKHKTDDSAVVIKPLGPSDLDHLSPHSIARQLICIAQKNKNSSIIQENIGRTTEYRDIIMWKMKEKQYFRSNKQFRANDDKKYVEEGPEKKIIFIVHGLSVMGWGELPCLSKTKEFETLLSYYVENLDSFDIFLIPMANPDGVVEHNKNTLWNKNMSPQKACPGVALDRNFDVAWNVSRTVNSCNGQYPGPSPFSELETQAIREVFHHYGHKIVGYFHVHGGTFEKDSFKGDAVLYPRGYTESQSDDDKYIDLKGEIDEALRNASFKVLSVSVDTLFNWYGKVAGTSVDYASTVYGIPYALELVMQLYEDDPQNPPAKREQNLALTEVWQMVLDVIFDHIYRSVVKNNQENEK